MSITRILSWHFLENERVDNFLKLLSQIYFIDEAIVTRVTRKQTLRSLLLSYQKKDGRAWTPPSFFWYDTDF